MQHKLVICSTCLKDSENTPQGVALAQSLREMIKNPDITVETVECMNVCSQPTSISFRADGKAAYLFADIDPQTDLGDIVAFADLYTDSKDGIITDARPAGRLRHLLVGRIPA
jgi:predicted metal-binding protein